MTVGMHGNDFIVIKKSRLTPLELWAFTTDEPLIKSIEFDEQHQDFKAVLRDGRRLKFPLSLFPELKDATDEQLHDVTSANMGSVLQWDELDVHYSVKGLLTVLDRSDILSHS